MYKTTKEIKVGDIVTFKKHKGIVVKKYEIKEGEVKCHIHWLDDDENVLPYVLEEKNLKHK